MFVHLIRHQLVFSFSLSCERLYFQHYVNAGFELSLLSVGTQPDYANHKVSACIILLCPSSVNKEALFNV